MKLLLTSAGITNKSLKKALKELVGEKIKTVFIPTAANLETGDKDWLVKDFQLFHELGYLDIVDIAALPREIWIKRLKKANVIVFGGGDTSYLIKKVRESGLDKDLPSPLKTRVYVGISAGSMLASNKIWCSSEFIYGDEIGKAPKGLNYTNINIRPHLNSPHFPKVTEKNISEISKKNPKEIIYALDDESGLKIIDGKIEVISEGKFKVFGITSTNYYI